MAILAAWFCRIGAGEVSAWTHAAHLGIVFGSPILLGGFWTLADARRGADDDEHRVARLRSSIGLSDDQGRNSTI